MSERRFSLFLGTSLLAASFLYRAPQNPNETVSHVDYQGVALKSSTPKADALAVIISIGATQSGNAAQAQNNHLMKKEKQQQKKTSKKLNTKCCTIDRFLSFPILTSQRT